MGSMKEIVLSETQTCRHSLAHFCKGTGVDIGHGGSEPIVRDAICIDLPDNVRERWGEHWPTHIRMDALKSPLPFKAGTLDYVYSSHLLEDAIDTCGVLIDWCEALKPGGMLVLFLPDQKSYLEHCLSFAVSPNQAHKHEDFGLRYVVLKLPAGMQVVRSAWPVPYNPYSFELVARKSL